MMTAMMKMVKPANMGRQAVNNSISISLLTKRLMAVPHTTGSGTGLVGRPPPPPELERDSTMGLGDPCLDLYFGLQPDVFAPRTSSCFKYKYVNQVLPLAWQRNPLTTLKLICNLRDSGDLGKSDREAFYWAALWLHQNHPKTLACNVASMAGEFSQAVGLMDDLVEILYRIIQRPATATPRPAAEKARERYERDSDFRFLHDRVSDLFADYLRSDIQNFKKIQQYQEPTTINYWDISSAPLFCPPVGSSLDRATLMCESIAKKVFPRESSPEYQGLEEAHYSNRVLDRLRKQVLVPLGDFLMSDASTSPVPGGEASQQYLEELKVGLLGCGKKIEIEACALLPHEIVSYLSDEDVGQVAELQWVRMVEDIYSRHGKFNNCLVVCNVSSSVCELHKCVSVALAVLVSQLSQEPWKGKVINFSPNPELHNVAALQDHSVMSKCAFLRRMDCGRKIDFHKVFDLILQVAVNGNLRPDQMIKKVLVLTSFGEFDAASANTRSCWESDYEAIRNKYKEKGYEDAVPHIVFWGLDTFGQVVVPCRRPGAATFCGFSDNLFKLFLDNDGEVGPHRFMEGAISGKEYQNLVVVD